MNYLFGFDFDGTLTPIVSHPDKVKIAPGHIQLLKQLRKQYQAPILILSGRSLSYLKKKFSSKLFYLAGNHGFECEGPKLKFVHPEAKKQAATLQQIKIKLKPFIKEYPGAWIEDKKYTFSVHYRSLDKKLHPLFCRKLKIFIKALPGKMGKMKLRPGKCVLEIRPKINWDKGKIYLWLKNKFKFKNENSFLFYAGDDVTDEDVFKIMANLNGLTVYVGKPGAKSKADYFVSSEKELQRALKLIFL